MGTKSDSIREFFNVHLSSLKLHESNGNWSSAQSSASYALLSLLAMAVLDCRTPEEGIAFIKSQRGLELLDKWEELAQRLPPEKKFMVFCAIGCAHVASFMGKHEIAEHFVARLNLEPECGYHFWDEYARAMQCLVAKQLYIPELEKVGKLTYSMRYWAVYLPVISDITHGRDYSGSLETMRQSFQKRITDKRIKDDGGLILEGSGHNPTHWDFRAEGLKAYAAYKYGQTFPS